MRLEDGRADPPPPTTKVNQTQSQTKATTIGSALPNPRLLAVPLRAELFQGSALSAQRPIPGPREAHQRSALTGINTCPSQRDLLTSLPRTPCVRIPDGEYMW